MHAVEDWSDTLLIHEVEHTLKAAAEQWGHVAYDEYTPFASLVPLLPASVQAQAERLLLAVPHKRVLSGRMMPTPPGSSCVRGLKRCGPPRTGRTRSWRRCTRRGRVARGQRASVSRGYGRATASCISNTSRRHIPTRS